MSGERSQLINEDEYQKFKSIIGNGSKILASTVARIYQANNNEWNHMFTGIITLTKDATRKKYLLQLYSLDNSNLAWEHSFGVNFIYNEYKKQIHTFNADFPTLLSFASLDESNKFKDEMLNVIKNRKETKEAKKRQSQMNSNYSSGFDPSVVSDGKLASKLEPKASQVKKGKLTKNDISNPTNFRHVDHMGLKDHFFENPNDENLKNFLKKNHMENLLNNEKDAKEIYDFIEERGGLQKLESEMKQQQQWQQQQQQVPIRKAPAVPQKVAPPPPDRFHGTPTPPQNFRPPPSGPVGPPPPPSGPVGPPPPPISHMAPPPPPMGAGVPPPPPPPPPAPGPPPIHIAAKPTGNTGAAPPPLAGKGGLLAEIEKFDAKKLKARSQADEVDVPPPAPVVGGSLLDSLATYLVQRKNLITGTSDSEDDDNEDDDDEWKD